MRTPSLTARISLLFAVAAVAVLLVAGVILSRSVDAHFRDMDRHELAGKLQLVGHQLAGVTGRAGLAELPWRLDDALVGHHGLAVRVRAPDGGVLYARGGAAFPARLGPELSEWDAGGVGWRGQSALLATGMDGVAPLEVAVALDIGHHRAFIAEFHRMLALVMALAASLTAVLGWAATRTGLRPLRRVTALAAGLSASRLDARLPQAHVPAEIETLTAAFNAMLARLDDAFRRLSAFSSDIAHELRTPVSNLMTQTQVALSRARGAEEYREVLQSGMEEYERLSRMISDMLFLAKADNRLIVPRREAIDLGSELARLLEFYDALASDKGVRLALTGSARVAGDRLMLQRAVANLLSNAIRHTAAGGTVTVALSEAPGAARITVANPGAPIPSEHLPRLFDRFYRVDPARREGAGEGAGLGLAIARSIVEAHGGEIDVASDAAGTRFEIRLPADLA